MKFKRVIAGISIFLISSNVLFTGKLIGFTAESNQVPTANNGTLAVTEGIKQVGMLVATDADEGDLLTYSVVSQGAMGTVVITDASTGAFEYYPTGDMTGNDSFTFKVNDGTIDSNIATVEVKIDINMEYTINTVVGNGSGSWNTPELNGGNDGLAWMAQAGTVAGIEFDDAGNLYYSDNSPGTEGSPSLNFKGIRKVDTAGIITKFAGRTGGAYPKPSYAEGNELKAEEANLRSLSGISVDDSNNLYMVDIWQDQVYKIDSATGIITTFAGVPTAGHHYGYIRDGIEAIEQYLMTPQDSAFDSQGNTYIAVKGHTGYYRQCRVLKVHADGSITTVAGTGVMESIDENGNEYVDVVEGIPATWAGFNPYDVAFNSSDDMFVIDRTNNSIRKVASAKTSGVPIAVTVQEENPEEPLAAVLAVDPVIGGDVVVTGTGSTNAFVYTVNVEKDGEWIASAEEDAKGVFSVTIPEGANLDTGMELKVYLSRSSDGVRGPATTVRVANVNDTVSVYSVKPVIDSAETVVAGAADPGARLLIKKAGTEIGTVTADWEGRYSMRILQQHVDAEIVPVELEIVPTDGGKITTVVDGLNNPSGIAFGPDGRLYIADMGNHRVLRVESDGTVTEVAGTGVAGFEGDGGLAKNAQLNNPVDIAFSSAGILHIADRYNYRVRKVYINHIPTAEAANFEVMAGESVSGTLSGFDMDGDPMEYEIIENGAKGSVEITDWNRGTFTYTANEDASGTDSFKFVLGDRVTHSVPATVTIAFKALRDTKSLSSLVYGTSKTPVAGFDPETLAYEVGISASVGSIAVTPEVTANIGASVGDIVYAKVSGTGAVDASGNLISPAADDMYSATVPVIAENETSRNYIVNFTIDATAPEAPVVDPVDNGDETVTGTAEPNATIKITAAGTVIGTATADADGNYSVAIATQATGTELAVSATDSANNESSPTVVTVEADTIAPAKPTVNPVSNRDTVVTGTTEPYATVIVSDDMKPSTDDPSIMVPGAAIGTATADAEGNYCVSISAQSEGTVLVVGAEDLAGNAGEAAQVTVTLFDETAPSAPDVNSVDADDTTVTGMAEANATVKVHVDGVVIATATADARGNYSVDILPQTVGTELTVTATDGAGNESLSSTVVVNADTTAPSIPVVKPVDNGDSVVTGTAEPNATVKVKVDGVVIGTAIVDANGNYSVAIPAQAADTVLTVTATDAYENESEAAEATVTADLAAPSVLSVNLVSSGDTVVTGVTEPNATVRVKVDGQVVGTAEADGAGNYSVPILPQNADTELAVTATDFVGNESEAVTAKVNGDSTCPDAPVVHAVYSGDTIVTGMAEPNATIIVTVNGVVIGTATVEAGGHYSMAIPVQTAGMELIVTATDKAGNESEAAKVIVGEDTIAPSAPLVNPTGNGDIMVTGNTVAYATVTVKVAGIVIGTAQADGTGQFEVPIPAQAEGTVLTVIASDAVGNESGAAVVTVSGDSGDVTSPAVPDANESDTDGTMLTGTAEADSIVKVKVNGQVIGTAVAEANGSYSATLVPIQPAGTVLTVTATDAAGNESEAVVVTVPGDDTTLPPAPGLKPVDSGSYRVTGTTEANATITIKVGETVIGTTVAEADGSYSVTLSETLSEGTVLKATATDATGNESLPATVTVSADAAGPSAPVVYPIDSNDTVLRGTTEPNAVVVVELEGQEVARTTADANGYYEATLIEAQPAGALLTVTATDEAGHGGESANVRVAADATAPELDVHPVRNSDMAVTGTTEPHAVVTVKVDSIVIGMASADADGNFIVVIPSQNAGTALSVTATDAAGNESMPVPVIVTEDSGVPSSPLVNPVDSGSRMVTGTVEPNATVKVMAAGAVLGVATADADGNYSVSILPQVAGTELSVTATDGAGNESAAAFATVMADTTAPDAPSVDRVDGNDTIVTGMAEPHATVVIMAEGEVIGVATADASGHYSTPIPVQKIGTVLDATATDQAGNESGKTIDIVAVVDETKPFVPTVNPVDNKDTVVTGTAEPNATVTVMAGETELGTATANADGEYSVEITPKEAGTVLIVTAADSAGNKSDAAETTVQMVDERADLSSLIISTGSFSPDFSSDTTRYSVRVANGVRSVSVTPVAAVPSAEITVNEKLVLSGTASDPIALNIGVNVIMVDVVAEDGITKKTYTIEITRASRTSSDSDSGNEPEEEEAGAIVANGESQSAGIEAVILEGDAVEVILDSEALVARIDQMAEVDDGASEEKVIEVAVTVQDASSVKTVLSGDVLKKMEDHAFSLSIATEDVEYIIPVEAIGIETVAEILAVGAADLESIEIGVVIQKPDENLVMEMQKQAAVQDVEIIFPPVDFMVVAKTTGANQVERTNTISTFSSYVERVVRIPDGNGRNRITTGVVHNGDGTITHIPTEVFRKDGEWYAKLNSLTNSSYSVIWNPVVVDSVENHWSKEAVNDMASRLVVKNPDAFMPDGRITRGEFAEYITKALGLLRTGAATESGFTDVESTSELLDAITIASDNGIITGYPDGTFQPEQEISRQEAMVMYARAMQIVELTGMAHDRINQYADYSDVEAWAKEYVEKVIAANVFNGTTETTLSPNAYFTYAEAAQAIRNLLIESGLINK